MSQAPSGVLERSPVSVSDSEMLIALSAGYGKLRGVRLIPETVDGGQADRSEWNRGCVWETTYLKDSNGKAPQTTDACIAAALNEFWDI